MIDLSKNKAFSASLGNYAESSSLFDDENSLKPISDNALEPNKFKGAQPTSSIWDADAKTTENYAYQSIARKAMLEDFYLIPEDQRPKKPHRVSNCRRDLRPVDMGKDSSGKRLFSISKPGIFKHTSTGNTFYGGLMICGSPYACPICVSKINEINAAEIRHAVSEWVNQGGICLFITLTFPHYRSDSFADIMQKFTKGALARFRSGKEFALIRKDLQYLGVIRSIEVTWGDANGFHPHSHEIWFVKRDFLYFNNSIKEALSFIEVQDLSESLKSFLLEPFKLRIFDKWRSACLASDLEPPSYERGIVIKIAETEEELQARLADYFVKTGVEKSPWGVDDEMTRLNSKKGKKDRYTPFDFLRQQFDLEISLNQKIRFRRLFAEYVNGFKGVSKIYWSPGLKKNFNIQEITDQAKAEQKTETATLEYQVPPSIWVFVVAIEDHRSELLLKVKNEGVPAAKEFLSGLLDKYADYFDDRFDELPVVYQYILNSIDEDFT